MIRAIKFKLHTNMREKASTLTAQPQPQEKSSSSGDESKSSAAELPTPKGTTRHGGGKAKRATRKVPSSSFEFFISFPELTVPEFIIYVVGSRY